MPQQTLSLHFPMGGYVRRVGFQQQSPYTTPSCNNVWPDDPLTGRERGGSRAGLAIHSSTSAIGGGIKVNLLADVGYVDSGVLSAKYVAMANGTVYHKIPTASSWTATAYTTGSSVQQTAAELFGKLYISGGAAGAIIQYTANGNAIAAISASAGTAPTNCRILVAWRSRLIATGDTSTLSTTAGPHMLYASAIDDPTNWDYAAVESTAAWYASGSDQGQIMEPITACFSHSNECLIVGCSSSLWVMRGDPTFGGRLIKLSDCIGIVDRCAWCYDPEGVLYFLSHDGMYRMQPGCGSTPQSVSRDLIPEELLKVDRALYTVSMAYDMRFRGIILSVALISGDGGNYYFIDTKTTSGALGFWPMTFGSSNFQPFYLYALKDYSPGSTNLGDVLVGGRDGVIRQFDRSASVDNGATAFSSYIDYGPFLLAGPGEMGLLQKLQVTAATGSADITTAVRVGNSAQEAFDASAFATYTQATAGLNASNYPRARGKAAVIKFSNTANSPWALEDVVITREPAGQLRIL